MDNMIPIRAWDQAPPTLTWEQKIAFLVYRFSKMDQIKAPVEHSFEPGVYVRTLRLPADALVLGSKHLKGHEVSLLSGKAILITPQGKMGYEGPASIHTVPGFYAVAYAVTDIVAQTRHPNPTEERDTKLLESQWFEPAATLLERGRLLAQEYLQ